jgi:hypothetical protein
VPTAGSLPTVWMALPPNVIVVPVVCEKLLVERQIIKSVANKLLAKTKALFLLIMETILLMIDEYKYIQ